MPNALAYLALLVWPLVCLHLFRRLSPERAVIWSILGAYLLLPPLTEFDLPLVPDLDKFSIANICAFGFAVFFLRHKVPLLPTSRAARVLMIAFVLCAVPTVFTNSDPIVFEVLAGSEPIIFKTDELPGLIWRDTFSVLSNQMIILMPFLLGRHYLSTEDGLKNLLWALLLAGLAYSVPALIEVRLSPQLNTWIYGFFQHDFRQMMRNGGFRPIVFFPHALWLAFFFMVTVVAAVALARHGRAEERPKYVFAALYLAAVLVLCKSLASQLYAMALLPVVVLASLRLQVTLAVGFALLAVTYPMLRNLELIPLDAILAQAEAISADRAQSLGYRFDNEEQLLERAREKWLFGWGGWGRNLVRHGETGQILSIPDGRWIIAFGSYGWLGYLSEMGLLATSLCLLGWRVLHNPTRTVTPYIAPVALILAITMVDMLLNDTLVPLTWLIAGAVLGHAEALRPKSDGEQRQAERQEGPVIGNTAGGDGNRTIL